MGAPTSGLSYFGGGVPRGIVSAFRMVRKRDNAR